MANLTFRPGYAAAAGTVLLAEVAIALWLRDPFIRPHVGDSLAVVLVYLGSRAVTRLRVCPALFVALVVAFAVEFAQLFHLVEKLGLGHSRIARIVLGTGFDPKDFLAYSAGGILVLLAEGVRQNTAGSTARKIAAGGPSAERPNR